MQSAKCKMQNFGVCDAYITAHRGRMRPTVAVKHYGGIVGVGD
jgi:hypothetical protein